MGNSANESGLIVVNCIILSRADIFARKNNVIDSVTDAVGIGLGFTIALAIIGVFREILGTGALVFAGQTIFNLSIEGMTIMILPPGALLTIGLVIATRNYFKQRAVAKVAAK